MIHTRIRLWEGLDVFEHGQHGFHPTLETYLLDGEQTRGVVLVCPGGGYEFTSPREAEPVAMQFAAAGWHAAVLWYSVAPHRHPQPLLDVSRAVCVIRERAAEWKVNPQKIAVCGFSAGGHLAASLGVHWNKPYLRNTPGIEDGLNRPDALILSYPVISSGEFRHAGSFHNLLGENPKPLLVEEMSLDLQVSEYTPPTFLWHTVTDEAVPVENSLLFAYALREHQIPFELHLYPDGVHGLSLATEETATPERRADPHIAGWMGLCLTWLSRTFKTESGVESDDEKT